MGGGSVSEAGSSRGVFFLLCGLSPSSISVCLSVPPTTATSSLLCSCYRWCWAKSKTTDEPTGPSTSPSLMCSSDTCARVCACPQLLSIPMPVLFLLCIDHFFPPARFQHGHERGQMLGEGGGVLQLTPGQQADGPQSQDLLGVQWQHRLPPHHLTHAPRCPRQVLCMCACEHLTPRLSLVSLGAALWI